MDSLPLVGDRISLSGYLATVKYVGNVENTTGIWIGVEWDSPERGKHDGVKDGKRYFSCRFPRAGSFIRPSPQVLRGVSFLQALKSKYVEEFYGTFSQEKVILGSSNGAIEVEAVNLDKIRGKFANLARLREVSLENELVATVDEPGSIRETCPNVRGLDLSRSLLPSWTAIAEIAAELPALQRLALNWNRFPEGPLGVSKMSSAFLNLTDLQLNGTFISWQALHQVTSFMPNLLSVELGHNGLCFLEPGNPNIGADSLISSINLEGNQCREWTRICQSMNLYKNLERLILTSNEIDRIPPPTHNDSPSLNALKHLSLNLNNLNSWNDLDALSLWCPSLISLTLSGNPLVESGNEVRYTRPFIIVRIPTLSILDSTAVSTKERIDSELLYLSYISQRFSNDESGSGLAQLTREHPRWEELSKKHGTTLSTSGNTGSHQDRLSRKLFEVLVWRVAVSTPAATTEWINPTTIRALPSMSLKVFRLKIRKTLSIDKESDFSLWLKMHDDSWTELQQVDSHDLDWLGLEAGSQLACCIKAR
ncbi:hypothetical protein GYMLUDRAFT_1006380 [Collybiopsis luxurians FD-317 M1]|uniref:CAP-Gly domain-containing protein n=1 Tax=Collybiopsis luxurians FD-317 M1 TaxID=944289 RepID=A0A0D0CIP8_9AGAR|nr:hypothetical protein GYMLUDRAFT_1006380 [Collybiopsis luxurians FD-317 M1]